MAARWIIRERRDEDIPSLLPQLNSAFSAQRTVGYYAWLKRNPHGPDIGTIAECPNTRKLVGHYNVIPTLVNISGEHFKFGLVMDVWVAPEWRGTGLATDVALSAAEFARQAGIDAIFGLPNKSNLSTCVRRLGHHPLGLMKFYHRRIGIQKQTKPFLGAASRWASALYRLPLTAGCSVNAAPMPCDVDDLFKRADRRADVYFCKDSASMTWRYRPGEHFFLRENGRPVAMAVIQWNGSNAFIGALLEADVGARQARRLVQRLVTHCARAGAENLYYCGTDEVFAEQALVGFQHAAELDRWIVVKVLSKPHLEPALFGGQQWGLMAGDTDIV